jgi:hypothetical protein
MGNSLNAGVRWSLTFVTYWETILITVKSSKKLKKCNLIKNTKINQETKIIKFNIK